MALRNTQMSSHNHRKSYFSAQLSDGTSKLDKQGIVIHVFKGVECDKSPANLKLMIIH